MRKRLKQQEQSQSAIALEIAPAGIEPTSKVPETFVLSIERRSRDGAHYDMSQCGCQACNPSQLSFIHQNALFLPPSVSSA